MSVHLQVVNIVDAKILLFRMENFVFDFIERHGYEETIRAYETKAGSKVDKISTSKNFEKFIFQAKRTDRRRKFHKLSFNVSVEYRSFYNRSI